MKKMEIKVVIDDGEKEILVSSDIKGSCTAAGLSKGIAGLLYGIEKSISVSVVIDALDDYTRMREDDEDK